MDRERKPRKARRHRIVVKGVPEDVYERFRQLAQARRQPMTRLAMEIIAQFVKDADRVTQAEQAEPGNPLRPEPMF